MEVDGGRVYLVGAGPGDEGLITVKGQRCLEKADVVLYDRLVNPILLQQAKENAELIYCGKLPERHILRQETINDLLVEKYKEGKVVVRLKGGDPSVFGRVGEEAARLAEENIPYEIVPGVTSSIAAASYAGIPVTHRDYSGSFAVVSGHDKSASGKPTINWKALAEGIDTLAFYMGVGNIDYITSQLLHYGKNPDTPVILIQWGTYGRQKTLTGTLATIAEKVKATKFKNPAITLVGDIVGLHEKLAWFQAKPLVGRGILLSRTGSEESTVAKQLKEQGAEVVEFPIFHPVPLYEKQAFKKAVFRLTRNGKPILFTSPESVHYFFKGLQHFQIDIRQIKGAMFVRSLKSKQALLSYGCFAEIKAQIDGPVTIFSEAGAAQTKENVDIIPTHAQKLSQASLIVLKRLLTEKALNTIVFPSAASVTRFVNNIKEIDLHLEEMDVVCFGPNSAEVARQNGIDVSSTLAKPTTDALIKELSSVPLPSKE